MTAAQELSAGHVIRPGESDYRMCTRTVMDTTDPDIWFDEDGVSSHALMYDEKYAKTVDDAQSGLLLPELEALVERIKASGAGKPYDCVIGLSGGVDSSYLMLQAVRLGLRPLAVHFDSGWNSELAVDNISRIVEKLDLDLFTDVVDWREMRDLQLSFFKAGVPNCDIPTDHAFPAVAYGQAAKYGIKYILSGSNLASESILPPAWGYDAADDVHVRAIQKRFGSVKLRTYPMTSAFEKYVRYPLIQHIATARPLNLMRYVYSEAKADIQSELGWRDYGGKHYESVFTRYFQGYYLPTKFGFDKRKAHYSSLILSGQMRREDALVALEAPAYPEELRLQDHDFIAKKLGVTSAELDALIAAPAHAHEEYPSGEKQTRRLTTVLTGLANATKGIRS